MRRLLTLHAHHILKGEHGDDLRKQHVQSLLRVPSAAAVAVTVHHTRQLALFTLWGIFGHQVAALDLLFLRIFLHAKK